MRKVQFENEEIYHIYNRGVEKRNIFTQDKDYLRFIYDLYEFNDINQKTNLSFYLESNQDIFQNSGRRELLVEILIFTLMPNHYHLVLKQKRERGIEKFMQKLGTGYTMYFNDKYERSGALFQGRFKAKIIDRESYFTHLPFYIHSNPLKLNYRGSTSIDFLKNYRWSSFRDYIGKYTFLNITSRGFILDYFGGEKAYEIAFRDWVNNIEVEPR